ncbi:MAG: glycoside hydrolase family 13 protein [Eubacterium sp.]|nr:glycoside hydrolase family 13 protein [Eubacterium sp.]
MSYFNSRKIEHKSRLCAIRVNEEVKLCIYLPRSMSCSRAVLCVTKDGEDSVSYEMFWAGMIGFDREKWEVHFSATTSGVYWYHFELDTPWGKNFIKNTGRGIGDIVADAGEFQQTVYDADFKTPSWLKGGIIYQIFPDRFYNSGEKKENVRPSRIMRKWGEEPFWKEEQMNGIWNNDYFGGDLKGIEKKLDYISELGVSCIYLNPIFEANSNHRYDTADYEKIDPLLGTEEDLKSLCKEAEKRGISIILDGVFSHTGCDSKYFNMFNNYDSVGAFNSKSSPYYSWYKFIDYPNDYQSWWGIKLLPEVIEENEEYRKYICSENGILRKWMRCGIKGWRLDVADELPDVFLDDLRRAVKAEDDDAVIIGEVWEDATNKTAYSVRRRYLLGKQLDSVMNYPFADAVLNLVRFRNAEAFFDEVLGIIENYPPEALHILMNHIGTHDTERAITRLAGDDCEGHGREWQHEHNKLSDEDYLRGVSMMKIASLVQFTLPGVPSIYYGDEIGMQGMKDPFNRACMSWDNVNEELLRWYRRLGEIRKGCTAFVDGEFIPVNCGHKTLAYKRVSEGNEVIVAVNLGDEAQEIEIGWEWDNSYAIFGESSKGGKITLPPFRYALLSR